MHGLRTIARHRSAQLLLLGCLLLCGLAGRAQWRIAPEVGAGLLFNQTDVLMDFGAGVSFQEIGLSAKLAFQSRIGTKRVLVETATPNLLYQLHERRYMLGADVDKRFGLTDFSDRKSVV